jgi:hypothetical protein
MRQRSYSDLVVRVCSPHRPLYSGVCGPSRIKCRVTWLSAAPQRTSTISLLELVASVCARTSAGALRA